MAHAGDASPTFLFTDIEGSTRRWSERPEAMRAALARHDALLRDRIGRHGGHVFKTVGDAFCAAFPSAPAALEAALGAQRALGAEDWSVFGPEFAPLRVRMALHSGEAEDRDGDYFGPTLNRVARLLAAGHGGQVLVSWASATLLEDRLPDGVSLRDLGLRRLKDLREPEQVFQLLAFNLPADFPPLVALDARPNNLPVQLTSLVGREAELASLSGALRVDGAPRLVTLTGPGGTGKTRLALQAAAMLIDDFPHGVWFVDLSPLTDPRHIPSAIAAILQIAETAGEGALETLVDWLKGRRLLLVLDNFEHLLSGAPIVTELLRRCPGLTILVTSRALLRVRGEQDVPVETLGSPAPDRPIPRERIGEYPAVQLFVQRAQAAQPRFALDGNAAAVAEICARLDGLPLAIELAAARMRMFTPEALLERLVGAGQELGALPLLTGGARDAATRQQALRATIAWSYDLLTGEEQRLLRRLAVFSRGWTLEAAEATCAPDDGAVGDVVDRLACLVDSSLVRVEDGPGGPRRYRILETIREFGLEELARAGEDAAARERHARYFAELANRSRSELHGARQNRVLEELEADVDNLRAMLSWTLRHDPFVGMAACTALFKFWWATEHIVEGHGWLERFLATTQPGPVEIRADALEAVANLAENLGLHEQKRRDLGAAAALLEGVDPGRAENIRRDMAIATLDAEGHEAELLEVLAAKLAYHEAREQTFEVAETIAMMSGCQRDGQRALDVLARSLELFRRLGDVNGIACSIRNMGAIMVAMGQPERGLPYVEEGLAMFRESINSSQTSNTLDTLGYTHLALGNLAAAHEAYAEGLAIAHRYGLHYCIDMCLAGLVVVADRAGQHARAVSLTGALVQVRAGRSSPREVHAVPLPSLDVLRSALGDEAFDRAWAAGEAMSLDEAVELALAESGP